MRILIAPTSEEACLLAEALCQIGHDARVDGSFSWQADIIHFLTGLPGTFNAADPHLARTAIITPDLIPDLLALDYKKWDPAVDPKLARRYNRNTLSLRKFNKAALQERQKLPVDQVIPLLGTCSDKTIKVIDQLAFQVVKLAPDEPMLYGGCDLVYTGGNKKAAMAAGRYGAVPVGDEAELVKKLEIFSQARQWEKLQQEIMTEDNSWDAAAKKCLAVYVRELNQKLFKTV